MRKYLFTLLLFFAITLFNFSDVYASTNPPSVTGKSVVVMDAKTGTVLYGSEENTQYPPASTTKLMTVLLTLENLSLNEVVTVGDYPPTIEGSKIYIDRTEQMTVEDMLYSVIMVSANDCATALAEHISGSVEEFSNLMNKRAKELGCQNTNFVNPHGLYDEKHRTTAYDLALIERELLKHPKYIEISKTKSKQLEPTNIFKEPRPLWNDNKLLHDYYEYYYRDVIAGKTGYTDESLHSFVASAKRGDQGFIVSILYDEKKAYFRETPQLFDWAFENFKTEKLFSKGDELGTYETSNGSIIPLLADSDIFYARDLTDSATPVITIDKTNLDNKFFDKGDIVTTVSAKYKNQSYNSNIVSNSNYSQEILPVIGNLLTESNNTINYTKLFFIIVGSILGSIIFLIFTSRVIKKRSLAKKRKALFSSDTSYKKRY
ncbi:MAG: D-alanyl-D-alanine carboxypeptidase family protein [Clostridium sp.]|uniref:D-alanyl-D-alanine carboxypeptidase family protein n=1 Tax=Clostridium sp. TaxID=1506 RepID=UPI00306EC633